MSSNFIRRLFRSAWPRAKQAEAARVSESDTNSKPAKDDREKSPQRKKWPYADLIETRSIDLDGEVVSLSQWRQDADRSMAFSNEPNFLLAVDQDAFFDTMRFVHCGPYPRGTVALCRSFGAVSKLVESLGVSLLILYPQNLLLYDRGESLLSLLQRLPHLRVQVYSGWEGVEDFFVGAAQASRIELLCVSAHPKDFHLNMGQMFRFELPKWFVEGYLS